jgi:hypothetical protein
MGNKAPKITLEHIYRDSPEILKVLSLSKQYEALRDKIAVLKKEGAHKVLIQAEEDKLWRLGNDLAQRENLHDLILKRAKIECR